MTLQNIKPLVHENSSAIVIMKLHTGTSKGALHFQILISTSSYHCSSRSLKHYLANTQATVNHGMAQLWEINCGQQWKLWLELGINIRLQEIEDSAIPWVRVADARFPAAKQRFSKLMASHIITSWHDYQTEKSSYHTCAQHENRSNDVPSGEFGRGYIPPFNPAIFTFLHT